VRRLGIALVALVLAAFAAWHFRPRPSAAPSAGAAALTAGAAPKAAAEVNPAAPVPESTTPGVVADYPSRLADDLNSPKTDIRADLRLINDIFLAYRSAVRTDNPVGDNVDITAALTGKNRIGFAFIPKDNPAINSKGELCDRWGTPYFFHQLAGDQMEIRSAGPDRKMWTSDDEVLTPGE
jgi:hypothetical protein